MSDRNSSPTQRTDVLIVTAVKDEQDVVLESEEDWREHTDPSGFAYFSRRDPGGLHWALARAADMGPELAANTATRLVVSLCPSERAPIFRFPYINRQISLVNF
jgi:hypothetical protein